MKGKSELNCVAQLHMSQVTLERDRVSTQRASPDVPREQTETQWADRGDLREWAQVIGL